MRNTEEGRDSVKTAERRTYKHNNKTSNAEDRRRRRQGRIGQGGGDLAQVLGTVTRVDLVRETMPAAQSQGLDRGIGDAARGRRGGRTDTEAVEGEAETGETREGHKLRQDR